MRVNLDGKAFLIAGGSGELGSRLARRLHSRGARLALTARDPSSLEELAGEVEATALSLEITDPESRSAALAAAERSLGGLDGLVVATGTVAFGRAGDLDAEAEDRVMAVNAIGPIALIAAALGPIRDDGAVVALSAVVAEFPTAGMAAYSASKAALSAYLSAVRRERRKELATVLDIRPGHMETGFADRSIAGEPPRMPAGEDADELAAAAVEALVAEKRELAYDPIKREYRIG